jgi:hypothetical protein
MDPMPLSPVIEGQDDEEGEADGGEEGEGNQTVEQREVWARVVLFVCGWGL